MLSMIVIESPLGPLHLVGTEAALTVVHLPGSEDAAPDETVRETPLLARAAAQLNEYFAGARVTFDVPLAPSGTPFQTSVWQVLATIPFGATWSYGDVARAIGQPSASRAVGAANGRNPIAIIVPCHRVIGSSGALTGYGGGMPAKKWLLAHEATHTTRAQTELALGNRRPSC